MNFITNSGRLAGVILTIASLSLNFNAMAEDKAAPKVVQPGENGGAPSDAIVLFDGKDLSQWQNEKGNPAQWVVTNGVATVNGTGNILTKQEFGDMQLHIEWASPAEVVGDGQGRGNSGVYFQGRYEIQVLDSYENPTYFDGQAGAFYSNFAPLVNPCRKPGQWEVYDIIFHAPKPSADGKDVTPGSFTVLFNGVLVQDHVPVKAPSVSAQFKGAAPKAPLMLQDHGNPIRYRNIWVRPLN